MPDDMMDVQPCLVITFRCHVAIVTIGVTIAMDTQMVEEVRGYKDTIFPRVFSLPFSSSRSIPISLLEIPFTVQSTRQSS